MGVGEGVIAVIEELPDESRSSILCDGGAGTELWGNEGPTGGVYNGEIGRAHV